MPFRLCMIKPNTDRTRTPAMLETVRSVLPGDTEILTLHAEHGAASIEGYADEAVAAAEVVRLVGAHPGWDAYLIACFGDPGLHGAREVADGPVVGIGAAGVLAACLVARRFAVLTTLTRGVPALEDALHEEGVLHRCVGVIPAGVPVSEQGVAFPDTTAALLEAGRVAVDERGAEAIVLACGSMTSVVAELEDALGVPVCDGLAFGASLALGLWRSGLRTSQRGAYASTSTDALART